VGLLRLLQLPDRPKTNAAALALDAVQGSQAADEPSSTLMLSTLFSAGEFITAGDFSLVSPAPTAAVAMLSERTDASVSCRERFRTGDNDDNDASRLTTGTVPTLLMSERNRLADFSVTDGKS